MFDFELTSTGDIHTEEIEPVSSFKLRFVISNYSAQRISFLVGLLPQQMNTSSPGAQRISFRFIESEENERTQSRNVEDMDEILQALMFSLRTELMDTYDYNVGTRFYQHQHTMYEGEESLDEIRSIIENKVNELLPGAGVLVRYEDDEKSGFFQWQNVNIILQYGDKSERLHLW